MRVLVVSWEYPPVMEGGLGRHVGKLAERLVADGVEVHVLTRGGGQLDAEETRGGVCVHRVDEPAFPWEMEAFVPWVADMNRHLTRRGLELCEQLEFDLLHSHDWLVTDAAQVVSLRSWLPWLVTIHATEHGRHGGWVAQHPQSYVHGAERSMAREADHLITCSEYMAAHVCEVFGVPARRVTTIPNGVDPAELAPAAVQELPALRARYAAPDERLVLMAGRLLYEKGFHVALAALAEVVKRPGGLRFVVAGTGLAESELKAQASRLGLQRHGSFIGWAGDEVLRSLYRVADITVVPSLYEPFGLVALEAMAAGGVCVASDTGGLREVVPDDGNAAVRFRSGDAAALTSVLRRLLADDALRVAIGQRARAHALQFSWARSARQTLDVYESLLSSGL